MISSEQIILPNLLREALQPYKMGKDIRGREQVILQRYNALLALWDNRYKAQFVAVEEQTVSGSISVFWVHAQVLTPVKGIDIKVDWGAGRAG